MDDDIVDDGFDVWDGDDNLPPEMTTDLAFGVALQILREGATVARAGWSGAHQHLEMQVPDAHSKMTLPYIFLFNAQGQRVPWAPSQGDLFAEDWMMVALPDAADADADAVALRRENVWLKKQIVGLRDQQLKSVIAALPVDPDGTVAALELAIKDRDRQIAFLRANSDAAADPDALMTSLMDKLGRAAASLKMIADGSLEDDCDHAAKTLRNIGF